MTTKIKIEENKETQHEQEAIVIQVQQSVPLITSFNQHSPNIYDILQINVFDYQSSTFLMMKTQKYIFEISTSTNKTLVKQERTSKDFDWLISTIKAKYPGIGLPVYVIPSSELNLAKQKCMVAELFLQRLSQHPILKYSPEVQAFFLDKLQYLQKSKEIDKVGVQFKGLSSWSLSSLVSHLERLTFKKYEPGKQSNWTSQFKQLLEMENQIVETISSLKAYINNLKIQSKIDHELIKKQSLAIVPGNCIQQFEKQQLNLSQIISQNTEKKKAKLHDNYLRVELIATIVMENLIDFQKIFKTMMNLQISIDSNAYSTDYEKLMASQHYLQLLMNNLSADAKSWLDYNYDMINNIY